LSIEELLSDVKEIREMEVKARDLYEAQLRRFSDTSIVKALSEISHDEEEHIQIASELIQVIESYKPEDSILKEALTAFTETSAFLLSLGIENYQKTNRITLKHLVNERGFKCLYVAVNKPSSSLIETFKAGDVNVDALSFIDCSTVGGETRRPTVSPENLTELSIAISELLKKVPEPRYVHLDSVSALYIFNQNDRVETFTHSLIRKLKADKAGLILVAVKNEMDEKALYRLRSFCDKDLKQ